jgi:hypothetical protein
VPQLRRLVVEFPPRRPGFDPRSSHVGFVVDKVALGQVFSEYFAFPCHSSFHRLLHIHHHLSPGAGTIGKLVADEPSGLSLKPNLNGNLTSIYYGGNIQNFHYYMPNFTGLFLDIKIRKKINIVYRPICTLRTFPKRLQVF